MNHAVPIPVIVSLRKGFPQACFISIFIGAVSIGMVDSIKLAISKKGPVINRNAVAIQAVVIEITINQIKLVLRKCILSGKFS